MNYNIHPIFVHFPIAFLLLYTVIKILPLQKWMPRIAWRDIERVLLVVGIAGAFVASSTGEIAEHITRPNQDLVEMHSLFASLSTWLYGIILTGEIIAVLNKKLIPKLSLPVASKFFHTIERILCNRMIVTTLAIIGMIALAITGLLGGVMVYGVTADPIAPFVLRILGLE
jgi:uncharacterized membrane protein